jgi:hypothetical protein
MTRLTKSDDYQPLAWIGRCPVYATTALVVLHATTAILTAVLISLGKSSFFSHLYFSSAAVSGHYELWQFFTYAFVNMPTIWFVVELILLYWFGRQVEGFIGRRDFLALYGFLLILPPCSLMAVGAFSPVEYGGSQILNFCVFLAFATLYPNVELFFTIKAKWIAVCFLAIDSLQMLAAHSWVAMMVLGLSAFTAFFFIGRLRYGFEVPGLQRIKDSLAPKRSGAAPPRKAPERARKEDLLVTVDSLLEKISSKGLASLSDKEREQLSRASEELKRGGRKSP